MTEKTPNKFKHLLKIAKTLGIALGIIIVIIIIMDKIVMPAYVQLGDEVEMPDVTERDYTEALMILKEHDFKVIKEGKYNPYRNVGIVLSQNPEPFTVVKEGRTVQLTVSLGEQLVKVPNLVGISERDAEIKLLERNLNLGDIYYKPSNFPEGTIISQQYEPLMEVSKNTDIDITVSIGSEQQDVILPNLVYKSLNDAENILKRKGLYLGDIQAQVNNTLLPNTVVNQFPPPGFTLSLGDTVFIVISMIDSSATHKFD